MFILELNLCNYLFQFAVPASVTDEDLRKVAVFRSRERIPVSHLERRTTEVLHFVFGLVQFCAKAQTDSFNSSGKVIN